MDLHVLHTLGCVGTPNDRDEVNRREVWEREWVVEVVYCETIKRNPNKKLLYETSPMILLQQNIKDENRG